MHVFRLSLYFAFGSTNCLTNLTVLAFFHAWTTHESQTGSTVYQEKNEH